MFTQEMLHNCKESVSTAQTVKIPLTISYYIAHCTRQHQNQTTARSTEYTQHALWIHYTTATSSHLHYMSAMNRRDKIV